MVESHLNDRARGLARGDQLISQVVESPIERVFFMALHLNADAGSPYNAFISCKAGPAPATAPFDGLHVYLQATVDSYRVDGLCLLQIGDSVSFTVVECDGHDYHERTKEQASRDRSRDRHFAAKGWRVVRFTGSEIWRDPQRCAAELIDIVFGLNAE
ncbi:MAG: DUF559 domain-containing protein [Myxococcota bacterium]|jgi:very-short-patch-repair endonuclease